MDELTLPSHAEASATPLSLDALDRLPDAVLRPAYARADLTPGIVHIGLGNFHRAHQAWYLHRLMQAGRAHDWAVLGAGVRPYDAEMRGRLLAQDCLTTLIQLDPDERAVEVTGAMVDYLPVKQGHAPLVAAMADPRIRIVSLTVTEGGYYRNEAGGLDTGHDDIRHDMNANAPRTAFGALVAALAARKAAGVGAFTGLSCDNVQGNGDALREVVLAIARARDETLADWIEANATFPNSMVDCIVPATGPAERALAREAGVEDAAPVTHERFRQWVIEDRFTAGRPDWEAVGATLTDDVAAYEEMKLRLLNAGHQVLANAGELLGVRTIDGCVAHELIGPFFDKVMGEEAVPHIAAVPGRTPRAYLALVRTRFANPLIRDTVRRVAFDGSSRHPGFVLPSVRDALAGGAPLEGLALAEALWARMCAGTREDGSAIEPNDPHWARRQAVAHQARRDPSAWLAQGEVYGDLASRDRFADAFAVALRALWSLGTAATIARHLD